jgi:hypothetical protein
MHRIARPVFGHFSNSGWLSFYVQNIALTISIPIFLKYALSADDA